MQSLIYIWLVLTTCKWISPLPSMTCLLEELKTFIFTPQKCSVSTYFWKLPMHYTWAGDLKVMNHLQISLDSCPCSAHWLLQGRLLKHFQGNATKTQGLCSSNLSFPATLQLILLSLSFLTHLGLCLVSIFSKLNNILFIDIYKDSELTKKYNGIISTKIRIIVTLVE